MAIVSNPIGRVQPLFKGAWNDVTDYVKLDIVTRNGNSYICVRDNTNQEPPATLPSTSFWQTLVTKGEKGNTGDAAGFGQPSATATLLSIGGPTVGVTATGSAQAKIFNFDFGIPAGLPAGFSSEMNVSATTLSASEAAWASVSVDPSSPDTAKKFTFNFGIPRGYAGDGAVSSVDGIGVEDSAGNVQLSAVRYAAQTLTTTQRKQARENISALAAPTSPSTGQVLQYNGSEQGWTAAWVKGMPPGGALGAVLQKSSSTDYDVGWVSLITTADIDEMFE